MDYSSYIKGWEQRLNEEHKQTEEKFRQSRKIASKCAHKLIEQYNADHVYLVGSTTDHSRFHSGSDIDLAVEGLDPADYYPALSDCWKELPEGYELDLIPLEDVTEKTRESLLADGVRLAA